MNQSILKRFHKSVLTAIIFLIACLLPNIASAEDVSKKELKKKIINAWMENSIKIKTFHFKYEQTMTYHKGMANYYYRLATEDTDLKPLPEKTTKTKQECEILINQDKIRYNSKGLYYTFGINKIYNYKRTGFINEKSQFYFINDPSDNPYPSAEFIKPGKVVFPMFPSFWFPIKFCTMPFSFDEYSDEFNIDTVQLKILKMPKNNHGLVIIEIPSISKQAKSVVMIIDPQQRYLPIKIDITYQLKDLSNNNSSYHWIIPKWKKGDHCYLPQSWTWHYKTSDGAKIQTASYKSLALKINSPIPDTVFDMKIPYGTVVDDQIQNLNYIIQKEGIQRIFPAESLKRGDEDFRSDIYKILMNPKYNHLKTEEEIDNILNRSREN